MHSYQIVIKNYRCFSDESPARFEISKGMIAFLGINNSGKSALLKFFQELRNVWIQASTFQGVGSPTAFAAAFIHVFDQEEVFCDLNERSMSIEMEALNVPETDLSNRKNITKIILSCARTNATPKQWSLKYFSKNYEIPTNQGAAIIPDGFKIQNQGAEYNLAPIREILNLLANSLYIGPFRNAITVGSGAHYELTVGETFINTWNEWQNGANKANNRAINSVTENIRRVMGFSQLNITASIQTKTLQLNIENRPYKLNEVGAGLAQLIVVFGNALIRKPAIVLIDEPELNLHPRLQLEFLTNLGSYASYGVVFATHSMGLARSAAEKIYAVSRIAGKSSIAPYEKRVDLIELLGELSFSAYRELGCRKLLLVEGTTDVKVMQQLLRKVGKDHEVVVLPLGGNSLARGGVDHELAELKRVAEEIWAIVDSERETEGGAPAQVRSEFAKSCENLGFKVLLTSRRATENYFPDSAVKTALGNSFSALGPFERLESHANAWAKADNWRIAQAMERASFEETDLGAFINTI
ncbi:AAA family ATPase [Trinickia sp. YCB016]